MSEDDWGFDPGFARKLAPLFDTLYTRWWRVEAEGADEVPAEGPALVVANQAGGQPWDAAMVATALRRENVRRDDPPRLLVGGSVFELPWVSTALRRLGGVPAGAGNAARLLAEGHVVMAFPEGGRGTGASYAQRYRLERLALGGLAELALRSGAPVVPCALVGGGSGVVDRVLARLPRPPVALPVLPAPERWHIGFGEPLRVAHQGREAAEDPALVLELGDDIRARLQEKVYDSLVNRKGAL